MLPRAFVPIVPYLGFAIAGLGMVYAWRRRVTDSEWSDRTVLRNRVLGVVFGLIVIGLALGIATQRPQDASIEYEVIGLSAFVVLCTAYQIMTAKRGH